MGYGRDPTVAARILLARLLLARCVQQQVPMVDDSLQFIDVVNVPVIMCDCGSAPDSGHRGLGGRSGSSDMGIAVSSICVKNNHNNGNPQQPPTVEKPPPHSGELNRALSPVGGTTQSELSRPMSSRLHGAPTPEETSKLNSDTHASNEISLIEIRAKREKKKFNTKERK